MSTDNEVGDFQTLLSAFRQQVPERPERQPTFLEITRYPHYEDVCSNMLAFYFDPGKPHGLGRLFLDALAWVGGIDDQEWTRGQVEVTREEYTEAGKRIDILIQSDTHAVLIENKIHARTDNPFCDYAKHLDSLGQRHKHKFLLTPNPVEDSTAQGCGFENITHEQLVRKIRERLGAHLGWTRRDGGVADTRYLTFMLDFLNTLDNLLEDMAMDQKFLEFAKSHQHDVERLVGEVRKFQNERRWKINQLEKMVGGLSNYNKVTSEKWKEPDQMWDDLVHEVELGEGSKIVIEAWVSAEGWQFPIYFKETKDNARLVELLSKQEIPYEEKDGDISHKQRFEYDADLKDIADLLQDVVSKVADARSSGSY